ncbi:hypothetical protein NFHSH190041_17230 [Shewanella sp. NFH-SH190041]|nr:hypothetical protein NFHSH190041_17230 [Shewanella sp. NFH-SH190041]
MKVKSELSETLSLAGGGRDKPIYAKATMSKSLASHMVLVKGMLASVRFNGGFNQS